VLEDLEEINRKNRLKLPSRRFCRRESDLEQQAIFMKMQKNLYEHWKNMGIVSYIDCMTDKDGNDVQIGPEVFL
jgi:hypothetical protein